MLPTGYKLLEWIESTGSQYVDTGVKPTDKTKLVWTLSNVTGNTYAAILTAPRFGIYVLTTGRIDMAFGDTGYTSSILTGVTFPATISIENGKVTANGVEATFTEQAEFTHTQTLPLFGSNSGGTVTPYGIARLHGSKVWENGTLIRDFIPCMTDSGEVGLWDDVNEVFYGDAAGVGFVAGALVELPEGYTRVEYIKSSGTQYIDTGFVPNQDSKVVLDFQQEGNAIGMFGSRTKFGSNAFTFLWGSNSYWASAYGTVAGVSSVSGDTNRHTIIKDKSDTYLDGSLLISSTSDDFTCPHSAYLFCYYDGSLSTGVSTIATGKVFSCQIFDNGALVRRYIPVIQDSDGDVGLYDLVQHEFVGNAGTGTFTAGPALYEQYQKLEYIESTGEQYVNTGVKPNGNTQIKAVVSGFPTSEAGSALFGTQSSSSDRFEFFVPGSTVCYRLYYSGTGYSFDGSISYDDRVDVVLTKNTISIGDSMLTHSEADFDCTTDLFILAHNTNGSASYQASLLLYSFKIYSDNAIVRDYIPVKRLSDGAIGLLDDVGGTFYANAGTGEFVAGPEVFEGVLTPEIFEEVRAVYLRWSEVDCQGYRIYRDGELAAETTNTFYADLGTDDNETYTYTLVAYRGTVESEPVSLEVHTKTGYFLFKPLIQSAFFQ